MSGADLQTTGFQMPDGASLLLVEDDLLVRRALRRLLQLEGAAVVEAEDGEQALQVIERDEAQLLDAVLTDLVMPAVSGRELIAVILECRPALPVVAMSAFDPVSHDLPPVPFLKKPFGPEELFGTLAPLVLRSQAMRRRARQSRADAAESRSLAERQRTIARDQQAKSGDLRKALMELRQKLDHGQA